MQSGWIKGFLHSVGLLVGVALALSGCNTVAGAVDGFSQDVSAIFGLVSRDQPAQKTSDADTEAAAPVNERAGGVSASPGTAPPLLPRANESVPSSAPKPSHQVERVERKTADSATTTAQVDPKTELEAAASSTPTQDATAPYFRVQVAAARNKADAHRAWENTRTDLGTILAGMEPYFERAETSDGIIYRIQTGQFRTSSEAHQFCKTLRERDAICFVIHPSVS